MVMADAPKPRDTFVLKRGAYDNPGEPGNARSSRSCRSLKPSGRTTAWDWRAGWWIARIR